MLYENETTMEEATRAIAPECLPENNLSATDLMMSGDPFYDPELEAEMMCLGYANGGERPTEKPSYVFPEEDERTVLLESVYVNR
ncbi:MAG: hypothetical protein CMF45_08645 [Legionellales bacterium]|nr:hypothetical protein [Legionellales bacterium]|tara:strand:+ start:628 stop:882 length:255 start_codon:yes stop_codon:yes gene_type:complete